MNSDRSHNVLKNLAEETKKKKKKCSVQKSSNSRLSQMDQNLELNDQSHWGFYNNQI